MAKKTSRKKITAPLPPKTVDLIALPKSNSIANNFGLWLPLLFLLGGFYFLFIEKNQLLGMLYWAVALCLQFFPIIHKKKPEMDSENT